MDATVLVAGMGVRSTLLGNWLAARWQRRSALVAQVHEAKVRVYGDGVADMYEFERATYDRVKAWLEALPEKHREELRQEAYRCNARARSAIGRVAMLSESNGLREGLESARRAIGDLNEVGDYEELRGQHDGIYEALGHVLATARAELVR